MEFSTLKTLLEKIIEEKGYIQENYDSNSNGPDSTSCPFCNASEFVKFRTGGWIDYKANIQQLNHNDDCLYKLLNQLESIMLNNNNIEKQLDTIILNKDKYNDEILYDGRDGELL